MRVSDEIRIDNNKAVKFSKCGDFLAFSRRKRLTVIEVESSDIISTFSCTNEIKSLHWHHDSDLILCVLEGNAVQAFSLCDPGWACKLKEGEPGLKDAIWSPSNYHILVLAQFNVRISVWSLTGEMVAQIDNPVLKGDNFSFSCDGSYYAVITGTPNNYKISVFSTSTWALYQEIACTREIASPSSPLWSPTNLHMAIWDTLDLKSIYLEVYSVDEARRLGLFQKNEPYKLCAIAEVSWVPSGQFLLIGCHDECVYVLNYITWNVLAVLEHSQVVAGRECTIYEEIRDENNFNLIKQRPVTLTMLKPFISVVPKIECIECDHLGNYVATKCASMPAVVWIWEVGMFSLKAVVTLTYDISHLSWSFNTTELSVCSKTSRIVLWRLDNIVHVEFSKFFGRCLDACSWCPGKNDRFSIIGGSSVFIVRDVNE